ncbi:MAG: hypothetical protein EZS28_032449, partial [Streblomastix strix]
MTQITSPRQISIPTIIDEDSPFDKNYQTSIDSPSQSTRRRSSIFENELTTDSSVCKWLLDIISEDKYMLKESAHFILSEPQLIRVVSHTFDVNEQQVQLNEDISTCCTRFMNDGTITLTEIRIGNVNIHALDENKVNLLRDTYKLCLQKVRKQHPFQTQARYLQKQCKQCRKDYQQFQINQQQLDALLLLKADKSELIDSYSKTDDDALILLKADKTELIDSYSKTEDDALLLLKADKSDTYSKTEDDALLLLKANVVDIVDSYSKTEDDAILLLKADKTELIDSYSKTEDDALLLLKVNVADLTNYVDLTSAQTITGQKQFSVINVSNISKQSKNDASILLAGGGDMLVSSLVAQPQLQEVRGIATGKSKVYVFSTYGELNDWMAIQDQVAKLVIGDNLYIIDKEVTDYWWDGTDLKVLETELPDISNVITTLGTATGGGNAITYISINGNILTPAKNKNFVDTDYGQSISGYKTFNTTIRSVGIMVQTYDNSSVICAGGGIRSIADIQSASYSKSDDDALLLLKADKSTTYTKTEDDAFLLLKADKTQLIDSYSKSETYVRDEVYTKGETNNLLNNKADTGVSYTKGEDDALLLLKADKTQLIDSYSKSETYARDEVYTKGETNNLLNNKTDTGVSYTKGEDDALLLLKADKSTTYTKTEDNALLLLKTDKSTTYTKTEDDALLLLKADKTQLIDSYTK